LPILIRILLIAALAVPFIVGNSVARAELAENAIGQIKTLVSGASIRRGDGSVDAELGGPVFEGDVLSTDSDGTVGVTFIDGTVLSLGPTSEIQIDAFIFEPQEKNLGFTAKFLSGTATYLSGRIAKLAPDTVNLSTPFSTIGIRGTRLLIKVGD